MITRHDLDALRVPLTTLIVTLIAAAIVVFVSAAVLDNARQLLGKRDSELKQARLKIQNAGEEKELISRYLSSYEQLARAGIVGDEQRITWLDSLRGANEEARIFGVEYDLSAQRPYTYAGEFNAGQLLVQESMMQLRFGMLHEEDLPRFLTALGRRGGGFFTVDECTIRRARSPDGVQRLEVQANLTAECSLRWLTIKPPAAEKKG